MTKETSECCGDNLYQYEDGWGICGHCKEWSRSESDYEAEAHRNFYANEN